MPEAPTPTREQTSLTRFIEEKHKPLAVLGVFIALTGFSSNFKFAGLAYLMSFLFGLLSILVWLQLSRSTPGLIMTLDLLLFKATLSLATLGMIIYWLLQFQTFILATLTFECFLIVAASLIALFSPVFQVKTFSEGQALIKAFLIIILLTFSLSLAYTLAPHLSKWIAPALNFILGELNAFFITNHFTNLSLEFPSITK